MKNPKVLIITLLCVVISTFTLQGQTVLNNNHSNAPRICRSDLQMREYYRAHPQALKENIEFSRVQRAVERPDKYVIPIVFHVFGTDFNGRTVNDALVIDALRKTNEDFQGTTYNYGDDDPVFDATKATLNIEFRLAEKDPSGAATTGIVYHRLESGFGNYWHPNLPLYAWDNSRYMNVYIMNDLYGDGVKNNSGVAWYPDTRMTYDNLARVTYNGAYLGTNTDENFRRVLTHEFGHYLNLAHTFDFDSSRFPNGCSPAIDGTPNPGDYVDDTPPADWELMGPNDLNCHGDKTNWTNFMNYSDRYSMYTQGQVERMLNALDHPSRITLWQNENLEHAFFSETETKRISLVSRDDLLEDDENNGSFSKSFVFRLINGQLANKEYVFGVDYTMDNLPSGLTPRLLRKSATSLELFFDGNANQHAEVNSISDLTITFNNPMLVSGELYTCKLPLKLYFRDAYDIYYVSNKSVTISPAYQWEFMQLDNRYEDSDFGFMSDQYAGANKDNLYIESYGKQMVGEGKNIGVLEYGEEIGASSNWTNSIGGYPNLGVLVSSNHNVWKDKLAFVGIKFRGTEAEDILYGWMKISVAEDGKSFTMVDYAFNEEPGASIKAGQKSVNFVASELILDKSTLTEDATANDGAVLGKVKVLIMGDNAFTKEGVLTLGVDYEFNSLPEGLTPKFEVLSDKEAVVSFEGKATYNNQADSKGSSIILRPEIFSKSEISGLSHNLYFRFYDAYVIKSGKYPDVKVSPSLNWKFFAVPEVDVDYGAWVYNQGHLKLETYNKPMVCIPGTKNIAPLGENTEIGPHSSWEYPSATPGQLDIVTNNFKEWHGKTAFAGLSFDYNQNKLYGWFKITVNADGTAYEVEEWAYNEQPGQSIMAGRLETNVSGNQVKEMKIYPNPASDQFYIDGLKNAHVKIYSVDGSQVWSGMLQSDHETVSVSSWSKGVYVVHTLQNSINHFRKIIVK